MSQWTLNWIVIIATGAGLIYFHPGRDVCWIIVGICVVGMLFQDHPLDVLK